MRTAVDGDSRSRVPSCGRRYADAPTAVLFTARGGGEFPPSYARQSSVLRTRAGLRSIRRSCLARRRSPARRSMRHNDGVSAAFDFTGGFRLASCFYAQKHYGSLTERRIFGFASWGGIHLTTQK
jgi:hypothetical protein